MNVRVSSPSLQPLRLLLGIMLVVPSLAMAQLGNVWHIPANAEPTGVPSMRNPLKAIVPTGAVTCYNGSYSLDGNQSGGLLWYRKAPAGAWSSLALTFDTQNGNNKYWRAAIPANAFNPGDSVQYYFEITFTDRATTFIYGNDTSSQTTATRATAQTGAFQFRVTIPWPGVGYPSDPASNVHFWKEEGVIGNGFMTVMLDMNGSLYDIYYPSVGNRHGMSTANEGYRGPEEFPNCPARDAQANGQMNVIAGMGGIAIGSNVYWLKNANGTDYTEVGQQYVPDNNVIRTTQRLNVAGNSIRIVQYDFCPVPSALPLVTDGSRTNRGVYVKRFLLTNLESTSRTIDFYYDVNWNINGGNGSDALYFDTSSNRNTMVAFDNTARDVTGTGCGPDGYANEYNPAGYSPYAKNLSVYFSTAMKLVTNSTSGAGAPADGAWRDHTSTDNQEGWIGKRVSLPPGQEVELDVMVVGSWDDFAGATGTHEFWARPVVDWFYTNSMAAAQTTTEAYWTSWLNSGVTIDFPGTNYESLWNRSLLVTALHIDAATGAIIAGMHNGAYPFVWPRDGVYAAITLARTGHTNESLAFYRWLRDIAYRAHDSGIGDKGFFYQKYTTDGYQIWTSPQVDETASVPWGAYYHYLATGDRAFLTNFWNLVYTSARASSEDSTVDPRLNYNDTYHLMDGNNVWEDSWGLFLYSNASVERGLRDAARMAELLGQSSWATTFRNRADAIHGGLNNRLDARVEPSDTSHLGLVVPYESYTPTDPRMTNMIEWLHGRQASGGFTDNLVETGGDIAGLLRRYNHKVGGGVDDYWNGGPWFLATSWYGEYHARWQDYVGGKALVDVNRQKLDQLMTKLGPLGLGAEQIASGPGAQKYPGFWLQTAWPNVWESHSTLLDQMTLFLDFKPLTNGVALAPKLPSGWTNLVFRNLAWQGQRFDAAISEKTTTTRADINKLTPGALSVECVLRIPAGQKPVMIAVNTNFFAPAPADYDTNTGRVRIQATLPASTGSNTLLVTFANADTDGDGLPDSWELAHDLNPLSSAGDDGANGDPDLDRFTNLNEYLAGTEPRNPASLLRIVQTSPTGRMITWSSVLGRSYRVWATTNPTVPFAPLSEIIDAVHPTSSYTDTNTAIPSRFYRVQLIVP